MLANILYGSLTVVTLGIKKKTKNNSLPACRSLLVKSFLSNLLKLNEGIVCAGVWAEAFMTANKTKGNIILRDLMRRT